VNKTKIEWCDLTWNPVRAALKGFQSPEDAKRTIRKGTFCTRISPGCTNCYASTINKRFGNGLEYTVPNLEHIEFFLDDKILAEPVQRKKPARIFVGDMFDLFHEQIPVGFIAEVLRVALKTPRHTFQFLTKRAERMRVLVNNAQEHWGVTFGDHMHFGVSVEDQKRALERIPRLQETRAAVRFLSVEPQLEHIDLGHDTPEVGWISYLDGCDPVIPGIDWVICGGESGPGARPFNLAWAESLLAQCRDASVPYFFKQMGSRPYASKDSPSFSFNTLVFPSMRKDRIKGGDPEDWPEHLRVREFPAAQVEALV
jgi:protein gp37